MSGFPNQNVNPAFLNMNNGQGQNGAPQGGVNPAALAAQARAQAMLQQQQSSPARPAPAPAPTTANPQLLQQLIQQQQFQQQGSPLVRPQAASPTVRPQQTTQAAQIAALQNHLPAQYRAAITSGRMTAQQAIRQYMQARNAAQARAAASGQQSGASSPTTSRAGTPQPQAASSPQTQASNPGTPTPPAGIPPARPPPNQVSTGLGVTPTQPAPAALASAIPAATPPTFKLDESKLKVRSASPASSPAPSPAPAPQPRPEANKPKKKLAAPVPVYFNAIDPSLRDANAPRDNARPDVRFAEPAADSRRRGTEGMRGSMRNELARLMYAAGDALEPDLASVDYMEDLVVEFLADLCRPVPAIRPTPQSSHQPVPLTTSIVRHRLASRPVYRKYLDRFDTMAYLSGELARNRRIFNSTESHFDLVETVGRNYLEIDNVAAEPKKRGRPRKDPGDKKWTGPGAPPPGEEEKKERKKPGPKKGWKAARVAAGIQVPEPRFDSDGRRIKRPYKRKKKDESAVLEDAPKMEVD